MLRDVFYYGSKPNVHPREQFAENLADARLKATTRDFWIINEFCDYRNFDWDFDFEFLPDEDVWAEEHNNVWPSQHQKDSGTWLCPKEHSDLIIYRGDVDPVIRKNEKTDNWVELDLINHTKFDFSWHPDPTDPPYIYKWPCKFFPAEFKHVLEYRVPGATQEKYMNTIAELVPEYDRWVEHQAIDKDRFDMSWRPNPLDPPFIYVWGNKYIDGTLKPTIEYHAPGATDKKYMSALVSVLPESNRWWVLEDIEKSSFDFSWRPDPREPAFIYVFGNEQHDGTIMPTIEYRCPDATEVKYVDDIKAKLASKKELFEHLEDSYGLDYSWRPDPTSPPYIYAWGNQWNAPEDKVSVQYVVPGATEYKYMDGRSVRNPCMGNWVIPKDVDTTGFDFSWEPSPAAPPYIYEFATQWQKTGGPQYIVPGATEKQYVDFQKVRKLPSIDNWNVPDNIDSTGFDFSWHPDDTSPPYIYVFATQWAFSGGPVYNVPNAVEIKYVDDQIATAKSDMTNWVYDETLIDVESFDFSWHPYVEDQPYIYEFGTQYQKTGGPKYITPGADSSSPIKYIDTRILKATRLPNKSDSNWNILHDIDEFDFSWHPDQTEEPYIYIFGNQWYTAEDMPTVEYRVPGATQEKYVREVSARVSSNKNNWDIPKAIDENSFDFSWIPHPKDPLYIYQFATQWQKTGGPKYIVPGASEIKYTDVQKATYLPNQKNWDIPNNIDISEFDFSWHPDDTNPPYIYQFPTQWAISGGPRYIVPGASEIKYVETDKLAKVLPNKVNWEYDPTLIDASTFDFSWHPYMEDQPYIYQFGTQHQKTGGPRYIAPGATTNSPIKYVDTRIIKAVRLPNKNNWKVLDSLVIEDFDYSWHPDETETPYIYVFGNTQYHAEEMPTIQYIVEGATETKYIHDIVAKLGRNMKNWEVSNLLNISKFDFGWVPHPKSPPYIYQFGTILDKNDGPRYITPNNTGEVVYLERVEIEESAKLIVHQYYIETSLDDLVNEHPNEVFWAMRKNINYDDFDFSWRPGIEQAQYVQVFGSAESELTQTYFVNATQWLNGNRNFNWIENVELTDQSLVELFVKPDIFFVDRSNPESTARFEALKAKYGTRVQKTRYINSWVDTISRCTNRATSELVWVLNSDLDYSDFNFDYYPNPWQMKMVHVFGTQWSHWGTTFMVNTETFREDTKYVKIIEHLSNLNFVKDSRAKATKCSHDIIVVDHGNSETSDVVSILQQKAAERTVNVVKYTDSYLNTLKEVIKRQPEKKEHFIWVCSSVCDYTDFDFTYIIDPFARDNLHVFPSGKQKFGDTFFIDVNNAREIINELDQLEHFAKVNYNNTVRAERLPEPIIVTNDDTHTNVIDKITDFPYATFITSDNVDIDKIDVEPMNLWSAETKNIYITSTGATRIVVPKEIKDHVTTELYEYPYIKRAPKLSLSKPLDIVFVSNGETVADKNYDHLISFVGKLPNKIHRVDGINGRTEALHAAAEKSETPWFFGITAKLFINKKFDFNYQADRLQSPKHYIFNALNPVNDLFYGHQSMVLYNKNLVLNNPGVGLDFTLDSPHTTVELNSGTVIGDTDEHSTWRTAFREAVKLRKYSDNGDEVAKQRLDVWVNVGKGNYGHWSIMGAIDGLEFYDEVDGDLEQLRQSYYWDWLKDRFDSRY
jgi:hypothetical protein